MDNNINLETIIAPKDSSPLKEKIDNTAHLKDAHALNLFDYTDKDTEKLYLEKELNCFNKCKYVEPTELQTSSTRISKESNNIQKDLNIDTTQETNFNNIFESEKQYLQDEKELEATLTTIKTSTLIGIILCAANGIITDGIATGIVTGGIQGAIIGSLIGAVASICISSYLNNKTKANEPIEIFNNKIENIIKAKKIEDIKKDDTAA